MPQNQVRLPCLETLSHGELVVCLCILPLGAVPLCLGRFFCGNLVILDGGCPTRVVLLGRNPSALSCSHFFFFFLMSIFKVGVSGPQRRAELERQTHVRNRPVVIIPRETLFPPDQLPRLPREPWADLFCVHRSSSQLPASQTQGFISWPRLGVKLKPRTA